MSARPSLSIGIEDTQDLINDLKRVLDELG